MRGNVDTKNKKKQDATEFSLNGTHFFWRVIAETYVQQWTGIG